MRNTQIGMELEFLLTNPDGSISDRAIEVIRHPYNQGQIIEEGTHSVVEVRTEPYETIAGLDDDFTRTLGALEDITTSLGILAVPISVVGDEQVKLVTETARYVLVHELLGDNFSTIISACSTHCHIDREARVVDQFNLMTSMDTSFALFANSSMFLGNDDYNDGRVHAIRNIVFADLPLHGQLLEYAESLDQLMDNNRRRVEIIEQKLAGYAIGDSFTTWDSCWGPLRLREHTIELRNADANKLSVVLAKAALYRGVNDYVFGNNLEVKVSDVDTYGVTKDAIVLPNYRTLKVFERQALMEGLDSPDVSRYLTYLVNIAEKGLDSSEIRYLQPLKNMLKSGQNVSDILKQNGDNPTLYMRDLYMRDLELVAI